MPGHMPRSAAEEGEIVVRHRRERRTRHVEAIEQALREAAARFIDGDRPVGVVDVLDGELPRAREVKDELATVFITLKGKAREAATGVVPLVAAEPESKS